MLETAYNYITISLAYKLDVLYCKQHIMPVYSLRNYSGNLTTFPTMHNYQNTNV